MGVKLAVVGGGSTYTPELIEGIARRADRLAGRRAGAPRHRPGAARDRRRARRADAPAARVARPARPDRRHGRRDRRRRASCSSSCASAARRPGSSTRRSRRSSARSARRPPARAASRRRCAPCPVVLDIAERVAKRAAPGAWIVDFTNPVGIVTQALLDEGHRAIGLCNVAIGFQREFAKRYGVEPERVELGARRAQPPVVGARGPRRRRRSTAGDPRRRRRRRRSPSGSARRRRSSA